MADPHIEDAYRRGLEEGARAFAATLKVKPAYQKRLDEQARVATKPSPKVATDQAITKRSDLLQPIHPNAGTEAEYQKRLLRLVNEMAKSVVYWLKASYRANEPAVMAADADPADELRKAMSGLSRRWQKRFDDAADDMAKYFAQSVADRTDATFKAALRKAGFTIKFKMTAAQRDILKATVQQNVALIKSIPAQYLTQVEGSVMRAVQVGGDLGKLTAELQEHHGVTRRRAVNIARSQNSMATAALKRNRQLELGLDEEQWRHSGGGHHPRSSHVKAGKDRVVYNVRDGWYDPQAKVRCWPGSLIGCRCVGRPVIKGL